MNETIGEKIRRLRHEHGISQTELAKRAKIKQATLSYIEHNRTKPLESTVKRIMKELTGVEPPSRLRVRTCIDCGVKHAHRNNAIKRCEVCRNLRSVISECNGAHLPVLANLIVQKYGLRANDLIAALAIHIISLQANPYSTD